MDKIKNGNTFKVEHCSFDENLICGTNKAKYFFIHFISNVRKLNTS